MRKLHPSHAKCPFLASREGSGSSPGPLPDSFWTRFGARFGPPLGVHFGGRLGEHILITFGFFFECVGRVGKKKCSNEPKKESRKRENVKASKERRGGGNLSRTTEESILIWQSR